MQTSLHDHILHLEQKLQVMNDQLTDPNLTNDERLQLTRDIQLARLAIDYYRRAYELEKELG